MAEIVQFKASDDDQQAIIEMLEKALVKARAGEAVDGAVVLAIRDKNGPQFWHSYYGECAFGTLLAGISALEFDMHYGRYVAEVD